MHHSTSRWLAAAAGLTAAAGLLTACGSDDTTSDTLRYGLSSAPNCADPAQSSTNQTVNTSRQVADSLVDQNPDSGEITGWLAQRYETSPDSRTFTFHLRPDVTFSDGTPLTSAAVKKNFDALAGDATSTRTLQASGFLLGYDGTDTPDPHTAVVRFRDPNIQFLQAAATTQLAILAPATVERSFDDRCAGKNVIGSGPYTYADWQQNRSVTLTRRDSYAWAPEIGLAPEARYRTVELTVVPESGVRAGSLASGQLDGIADPAPQDRSTLQGAGAQYVSRANPGLPYVLQSNVSRGPLADPTVRQAVSFGINRQEVVDAALGGDSQPATSILASTTPGYRTEETVRFDPAAASAILDKDGWRAGADGIRVKDGQRLSFEVIYSPEFYANKSILELIQRQLASVGIDFRVTGLSNEAFLTRRAAGEYDAVYYNVTRADPDILRARLGIGGTNYSRRGPDPTVDPLLTEQAGLADRDKRFAVVSDVQKELLVANYAIPVVERTQYAAVASGVPPIVFDGSGVLRLQFSGDRQ